MTRSHDAVLAVDSDRRQGLSWARMTRSSLAPRVRHIALTLFVLAGACNRPTSGDDSGADPTSTEPTGETRLLEGRFETVAKRASGTAAIFQHGSAYELRLSDVTLEHDGEVRVYLVSGDSAASTAAVDGASLKYDLAALDTAVSGQTITLPSKPAPELRSVVLWNAKYGANLAAASLR